MIKLQTYLEKLNAFEGAPPADLIAPWIPAEAEAIVAAFQDALPRSNIDLTTARDLNLAALGNHLESAFCAAFQETLAGYRLTRYEGPGYPDERLEDLARGKVYAFEVKAKTEFDLLTTARMVLLCGTRKLRRHFSLDQPLRHVLLTILYSLEEQGAVNAVLVNGLRFDFLEPWSLVEERYEGSVSPKLLSKSDHLVGYCAPVEPAADQQALRVPACFGLQTIGQGAGLPGLQLRLALAPPTPEGHGEKLAA